MNKMYFVKIYKINNYKLICTLKILKELHIYS